MDGVHLPPATIRLPEGWNGPAASANGGVAAGAAAAPLGGLDGRPVSVRLHAPPPMGVGLAVVSDPDGHLAMADADGEMVLSSRPADQPLPDGLPEVDLTAVPVGAPDRTHAAPTCIVCGPDHPRGLRMFPVPLADGVVGTRWTPPTWALTDDVLDPLLVWAVLDCPGAFAVMGAEDDEVFAALAGMTARIDAPVPDEQLVVLGWTLPGATGRRRPCATAVLDGRGRVLARSVQTCVVVPPSWARGG